MWMLICRPHCGVARKARRVVVVVVVVVVRRGRRAKARRCVWRVMKDMLGWRVLHKSTRWKRRRGDALGVKGGGGVG